MMSDVSALLQLYLQSTDPIFSCTVNLIVYVLQDNINLIKC